MDTISTKVMREAAYIDSKMAHMRRIGIATGVGLYGGACPKWLQDDREAAERVRIKRNRARDLVRERA